MERTEQMYTIQKQMDFGKIKVRANHMFLHKLPHHNSFEVSDEMLVKVVDIKSKEHIEAWSGLVSW